MRCIILEWNADKSVPGTAVREELLSWERRTVSDDMVGEHEKATKARPKHSFPPGEAFQFVVRGPVSPVLSLTTGRKAAPLHIDQPGPSPSRGDQEVEA